jgi:polyisoprenoid-binding protein YceI
MKLILAAAAAALLAIGCAQGPVNKSPATYGVDSLKSRIDFVTVKAGQPGAAGVSEVSRFERFSGGMTSAGQISLDIDLSSVATGVGIRDERLRNLLFNVNMHPKANFSASVSPAVIAAIPDRGAIDLDVEGQLRLAGQVRSMAAKLRVARLDAGALQVSSLSPIVVDASQFGLKPGVDALREVMGLAFIAAASPVTFTLVLHEQR